MTYRPVGWSQFSTVPDAVDAITDSLGNIIIDTTTDGDITGDALTEFILYGVWNGSFSLGPSLGSNCEIDSNDELRRLPYWTGPVSVSGGSITCSWVADAASPSGHNLRFTVTAGAASDETYIEQIVPVGGSRTRQTGDSIRLSIYRVSGTATFRAVVNAQYLTAAGATTGGVVESTEDLIADATGYWIHSFVGGTENSPPADARSVRVRIGIRRAGGAGTSDTGTFDFTDVRRSRADPIILIAERDTPATYAPGTIQQADGVVRIAPDAGTGAGDILIENATGLTPSGGFRLPEVSAPSTPASGYLATYADTSGVFRPLNDAGLAKIGVDGVVFPATQVDAADVNTLDDYDEGTFTPSFKYATVGTSTWSHSTQVGTYTKIGNKVFYKIQLNAVPTNGTASGGLQVAGLPFTADSVALDAGETILGGYTKANFTQITFCPSASATVGTLRASGSAQSPTNLAVGDIPTGGTVSLRASGHYQTP